MKQTFWDARWYKNVIGPADGHTWWITTPWCAFVVYNYALEPWTLQLINGWAFYWGRYPNFPHESPWLNRIRVVDFADIEHLELTGGFNWHQ